MRQARFFLVASSLAVAGVTIWAAGCTTFYDECVNRVDPERSLCGPFNPGAAKACTGDPTLDPTLISDKCGLFVRADDAGDDTALGTREQPLKTIKAAVDKVGKQWIFVCSSNPVQEKLLIGKDNVTIFGGFDCANGWAWAAGSKTTLQGAANEVTLTITGQGVELRDFTIHGVDATSESASSIAVLVSTANPTFTRCDMIAGKAKDGEPGDSIQPATAPPGQDGKPGADACSLATVPGGEQSVNNCPGSEVSIGGEGGSGTALSGGPGVAGQPDNLGGKPGEGEPSTATTPPWSCVVGAGKAGGPGGVGMAGSGATADLSLGSLTVDGFIPVAGKDGTPGQPGQGGGGGGAAKGGSACAGATKGGGSGGSGGSGGCGGGGGRGGQGAGASIALVSLASTGITLKDVTLTAVAGAKGGDGGDAQRGGDGGTNGGTGGTGGFNLNDGCPGGPGGPGGNGGPGGGGRGGHSLGLAYTDNPPALGTTKIIFGAPGDGGRGGNQDLLMNHGDPGVAAVTQAFSAPK